MSQPYLIIRFVIVLVQIENIVSDPEKAQEAGVKTNDPWWVIVPKVLAYLIGLLLGGVVTTSCTGRIF